MVLIKKLLRLFEHAPDYDRATSVTGRRYRPIMDVIAQAAGQGFMLEERVIGDGWVWGWSRGDDDRWPCFLERRQAVSWMVDRLKRTAVFE